MKSLLALLLLTTFVNSYASTEEKVTPMYGTTCESTRYNNDALNSVENLQLTETDKEVEVSFDTYLVSCTKNGMERIDISDFKVLSIFHEGINAPISKKDPTYKITNASNLDAHIVITFNKSQIFKKTNDHTFDYRLENPRKGYYLWKLNLKYEKNLDKTSVRFIK